MTPDEFKAWRKRMGWTQTETAEVLGLSLSTVGNFERGIRREDGRPAPVPLPIQSLCATHRHIRDEIEKTEEHLEWARVTPGQMEQTMANPEWRDVTERVIAETERRLAELERVSKEIRQKPAS